MKETIIRVGLIDYTGNGHRDPLFAARLLAFTKSTRLNVSPSGFGDFLAMPEAEVLEHIQYMVTTLPSSWEFVDATFIIQDVSRACAQQITRTRWSPMESDMFGSYAMQAQRVVDVSDVACYVPERLEGAERSRYIARLEEAMEGYRETLASGVHNEDARDYKLRIAKAADLLIVG